jgi:hypothetical protein
MNKAFFKGIIICLSGLLIIAGCRNKRKLQQTPVTKVETPIDSSGKCKMDFKNSKSLMQHIKENEFKYDWMYAKANVEYKEGEGENAKEESFDIRVKVKKDSAILISIQALSLVDVAKVLITKDSVKLVDYIHKQYFKGDYNYINEILRADLDYEVIQALLFGNSAEFYDDEQKLKPVTDRQNCVYRLSTERKRRLRRIEQGETQPKQSLQTLTLDPNTFKIITNEFIDVATNRFFEVKYSKFNMPDSIYAPHLVDIEIKAEKKVKAKIEYVRMDKNVPQKVTLNIPSKYDPIKIQGK